MKNLDWQQRKQQAFARGMGNMYPVYVSSAKNAEIWDVEGNRYIDFAAGIAVVNTGHSHPTVVDAMKRQLDAFSHTCVMVTPYASAVELAEKICEAAPISDARAMFVSTGAEAVENAVKAAIDCVQRRLPRTHQSLHGADRQGSSVQEGVRALYARDLPCAVSCRVSWCHCRGFPGRPGAVVQLRYPG